MIETTATAATRQRHRQRRQWRRHRVVSGGDAEYNEGKTGVRSRACALSVTSTLDSVDAAKARGVKLGGRREEAVKASRAKKGEAVKRAEKLRGLIAPMVADGMSRRSIADALNAAGHTTERGLQWSHTTVGRVIVRLGL